MRTMFPWEQSGKLWDSSQESAPPNSLFLSPALRRNPGNTSVCVPGNSFSPHTDRKNPLPFHLWGEYWRTNHHAGLKEDWSLPIQKCGSWAQLRRLITCLSQHQCEDTPGSAGNLWEWRSVGHGLHHQQHQSVLGAGSLPILALLTQGKQIRVLRAGGKRLLLSLSAYEQPCQQHQYLHPGHGGGAPAEQPEAVPWEGWLPGGDPAPKPGLPAQGRGHPGQQVIQVQTEAARLLCIPHSIVLRQSDALLHLIDSQIASSHHK